MKIVFEIETINFSSVAALWVAQWLLNAHHHHHRRRRYPRRVRQTKKSHSILKASTRLSISIITQRINLSASHSHYSIESCSIAMLCIHFLCLISYFWIIYRICAGIVSGWLLECWQWQARLQYFLIFSRFLLASWQRVLILRWIYSLIFHGLIPPTTTRRMNYYENLVSYCANCAFSRGNCDNDAERIEMLIYKSIYVPNLGISSLVESSETHCSLHLSHVLCLRFIYDFAMHSGTNEIVVATTTGSCWMLMLMCRKFYVAKWDYVKTMSFGTEVWYLSYQKKNNGICEEMRKITRIRFR